LPVSFGFTMLTGYRRVRALWRAFRASDGPLPRRAWGLFVALLPPALRRRVLRVSGRLSRAPSWLFGLLVDLGGYLIMAAGALMALWLWSRIGAVLCASLSGSSCATIHAPPAPAPETTLSSRVTEPGETQ
jgi:hypothetical protein